MSFASAPSTAACPDIAGLDPCGHCAARGLSVCGALAEEGLRRLAALTEPLSLVPDQVLVREGDPATHLLNITSGTVRVSKLLPDGRRQIVGFLMAGDFLGLATGERYAFTAETIGAASACRFSRTAYRKLLGELPALEAALLERASHDLQAAQNHILLLGRKTAMERLASFLIDLSTRTARAGGDATLIDLPMTRSEIADYLGLTLETVSRTMTRLKASGVVSLPSRRAAAIAAPGRLRALSGEI
ncbi:MAG: helix-turn-helix domain-containing protein [Pseudomonadota bacterium]